MSVSGGISLRIEKLSKRFKTAEVLKEIDLDVPPGQFIAIVGKSGCGKSTLLRLIAGLEAPTSGAIRLDHLPARGIDPRVRVIFQESRLLPWETVLSNVALAGPDLPWQRAQALLEHVGLPSRGGEWPGILSGGQRQRVALARALITEPRLLLFDEPLGALDALTRLEMQTLVERLWMEKGFTAVLVTHDVEEAVALADRVLLIEDHRISLDVPVALGRPRDRASREFAAIRSFILDRILEKSRPCREEGQDMSQVEQLA